MRIQLKCALIKNRWPRILITNKKKLNTISHGLKLAIKYSKKKYIYRASMELEKESCCGYEKWMNVHLNDGRNSISANMHRNSAAISRDQIE